jgi:RNA 3'-terminal phosphate cyclase-like protein
MLTLRGITTDEKDLSVDLIRTVTLPHLAMFGVEDGLELKVRIPIEPEARTVEV